MAEICTEGKIVKVNPSLRRSIGYLFNYDLMFIKCLLLNPSCSTLITDNGDEKIIPTLN